MFKLAVTVRGTSASSKLIPPAKTTDMTSELKISEMQANVARSQVHVAKQEVIIARLVSQEHEALAASARALLVTMNAHLALEMEMLARMQAELA